MTEDNIFSGMTEAQLADIAHAVQWGKTALSDTQQRAASGELPPSGVQAEADRISAEVDTAIMLAAMTDYQRQIARAAGMTDQEYIRLWQETNE